MLRVYLLAYRWSIMEDVVGSAFQLVHFFGQFVAHYISLIEDDVGVLAHFIFFLDQLQTTGRKLRILLVRPFVGCKSDWLMGTR